MNPEEIGGISGLLSGNSQAIYTFFAFWIFNAIVQALPEPDVVTPNKIYLFFFNLAHGIAANLKVIGKESRTRARVETIRQSFIGTGTGDGGVPTPAADKQFVKQVEKVLSDAAVARVEERVEASAAKTIMAI